MRRLAAVLLVLLATAGCGEPKVRPNLILITIDAARADHFSAYGYARPTSPALEKLARRGVLFEDAYSQSDWTLASLGSLLTGLEPARHGAVTPLWTLNPKVRTLPQILSDAGYQTAAICESYFHEARYGLSRGFTTYKTPDAHNADARELTAQALRWLAFNTNRPYFLWLHYFDPHAPYLPREPFYRRFHPARYEGKPDFSSSMDPNQVVPPGAPLPADVREQMLALYDSEIAHTDAAIGTLLDGVRTEDTLICITADHGEEFKEHGQIGHGLNLHREVIHVPLILCGPGVTPAGTRVARTVQQVDVVPTLLELAGIAVPQGLAGQSLVPYFSRPARSPDAVAFGEQMESSEFVSVYSLVQHPWHLLMHYGRQDAKLRATMLFDMTGDPTEQKDVFRESEASHRDLRSRLTAYVKAMGGPAAPTPVVAPADPERMRQLRSLGYLQGQ